MSDKISVGLVIHRSPATLIERLKMLNTNRYPLYLFDNSPLESAVREWAKNQTAVKYLTCGKNLGLGIGMSAVCAQSYYDGHSALLFFDQDTVFDYGTVAFVDRFYRTHSQLRSAYSAIVFNGNAPRGASQMYDVEDVLLARSSGSLFILQNLKTFDWHDESYFVDCVDYSFCLRSKRAGFRIGECKGAPGFDHESEQPDQQYRILGKRLMLRRYSPRRIRDSLLSSLKLMGSSIKAFEYAFFKEVGRALLIYGAAQILARLVRRRERPASGD